MTDKTKRIARRIQGNLRRIGVTSTIEEKAALITVSGTDPKGKPFAVRLRECTSMAELDDFADTCDNRRTHPRQPGDFILARPLDA